VGSFGHTVFSVSTDRVLTPSSFTRSVAARYEEHKVLGAAPRLEFLAPELPNMELAVRFHASFGVDPLAECNALEVACHTGKVEKLIIGGISWGDMILESVSETARHSGGAGGSGIAVIDVNLKFKRYL
ncbi:MAG: phage tail protein, partial [Desulfovibrionaceae bacterium]